MSWTDPVELPFWLVGLAMILASIGLLDRLLVPGLRWALRRRANRAIEKLNARLQLQIQPFKLTRRQVLIDRLVYDPEVLAAVEQEAAARGEPRDVALRRAEAIARETVPSFSAYTYFHIGTRAAKLLSQKLYRVRLGSIDEAGLKGVDPKSAVVFVANHRSNMDYVLVTYVASTASALSYAVGEWAQVWLLRNLIRAMGAYFVRRDSGDALYRKVLARYVHMATASGVTQVVFPEGGLSRNGALSKPKLGLLGYMVGGFDPQGARDIVFIPVGLNYDRVLEDRVLTAAAGASGKPKFRLDPGVLARYLARSIWLALRGRWNRNGYACVNFGSPLSLRQVLNQEGIADPRQLAEPARHDFVARLGDRLMASLAETVPVLPVSLLATVLLGAKDAPLTAFELSGQVHALMARLEQAGIYVHVPRADRDYAVQVGLRMLQRRRLVLEEDGAFRANTDERALLDYYANGIAHHLQRASNAAPAVV